MSDSVIRKLLAAVGTIAIVVGGLFVLLPPVGEVLPVDALVSLLGNDYLVAAAVAGVALSLGIVALVVRSLTGIEQTVPPDPEGVSRAPLFGSSFDDELTDWPGFIASLVGDPETVRDRLRDVAVTGEMRRQQCARPAARRTVETGEWTDDADAATYLAPPDSPSLGDRFRAWTNGESWYRHGAKRTAVAIVDEYGANDTGSSTQATRDVSGVDDSQSDRDQKHGRESTTNGSTRGQNPPGGAATR